MTLKNVMFSLWRLMTRTIVPQLSISFFFIKTSTNYFPVITYCLRYAIIYLASFSTLNFNYTPYKYLIQTFICFQASQYIITAGGIAALFGALLGGTFAVPRIIYAMAKDGLLFSYFSKVSERTITPVRAIIAASILAALIALIFDLKQLVEMLSIGTLMAYTMVAVSVIALRFQPGVQSIYDPGHDASTNGVFCCKTNQDAFRDYVKLDTSSITSSNPNSTMDTLSTKITDDAPDVQSSFLATASLALIVFGMGGVSAVFIGAWGNLRGEDPWAITTLILSSLVIIIGVVIMVLQPTNGAKFPFMVPCVPVLPLTSIMVNIFLLLKLSYLTWVRFAIWLTIGRQLVKTVVIYL